MDIDNEILSIFTESSESKGLLYDSYNFLNERITKFLDVIEDGIKKIRKDPINNDVNIREDITKFKDDVNITYSPSSINIRETSKMKSSINKYRSNTDAIFKRYTKLRHNMAFGGNYIHGILMKSKAYSKDINPEHYDKINKNVRNIDRALDWVEKILIDLFNMIDQDLNILTIIKNTYGKHKIYENSDDILDSSIYSDESTQKILTPSFISELGDKISSKSSSEYDPPLPYDQLPDHLKDDPVHVWRAKNGIELIHKEPTLEELNRIWNNWQLMSDEQKIISDNESIRLFGINNEDHYYALIKEYNNIKESYSFKDCDSPEELLRWMDRITYGWISNKDGNVYGTGDDDDEDVFYKNYRLQSPSMLSKTKVGVCWDQTELERSWFNYNKYMFMVFYIEINDKDNCPSHTFLVYETEYGYNWFEHSWRSQRGIHEYKTISACIKDIIQKHQNYANDVDSPVNIYKMPNPPKYGSTCEEFMKHAKNDKNRLDIYDISNDIFNESSGYNCDKCGNNLDTINILDIKKNEYENAMAEFPNWDGGYGKLGMIICPKCGKHNYIITGSKRWDEGANIMEDNLSWIDQYIKEEGEDPSAPPPLNVESQEEKKSMPKQTDARESDKNGVRRKKLYMAFIEWAKACNSKNTFGSIFDKDIFNVTYPFVPNDMRYFYRLANPILCVLSGDLTFFQVSELRKLNAKNSKINEMLIFAATPNDMRVFNIKDKKIYRGIDENGSLTLKEIIGDTFDLYIQNMIKQGDILNGPIEESYDMGF